VSDSVSIRKRLRELIMKKGVLTSTAAKEEDSVYSLYYEFRQPLPRLQGHQILAINRGEKEEFLRASVDIDRDLALNIVYSDFVKHGSKASDFVARAARTVMTGCSFPLWKEKSERRLPKRLPKALSIILPST
jgi:uncharacterized protein